MNEIIDDLTQSEPEAPPSPLTPSSQIVEGSSKRIEDYTRLALAGALVGVLAVLTLAAGWYVATYPEKEPAIESFMKLVFSPIVGLVGSVVGFYFGARTADNGSTRD